MTTRHQALKRANEANEILDSKRTKKSEDVSVNSIKERPLCKYGEKCYQKNPLHLKKFSHPHKENAGESNKGCSEVSLSIPCSSSEKNSEDVKKFGMENIHMSSESSTNINFSPQEKEVKPTNNVIKMVQTSHETPEKDSKKRQMLKSPMDVKENIKESFLVNMPEDFYQFWEFCKSLSAANTQEVLKDILGLELVGPFQLLYQSTKNEPLAEEPHNLLTQWRFYYDPPEFQTVIVGDINTGFHIGYFRDSPKETPTFVGSNTETEGCILTPIGENLFSALDHFITTQLKKADPFKKSQLASLKKKLEDWAISNEIEIETQNLVLKRRKQKMVAKTFYECGIVVPVNKKTKVGYRKIPETDAKIKKICKKIVESASLSEETKNSDPLQELVTYVQYANDECDYGMGLELGLDLLAFGGEVFHPTILHLLGVAYELLEREEFGIILKAHLKERRRIARSDQNN